MSENESGSAEAGPWYRSQYWLLLLPVILFGLWMWHSLAGPPTPVAETPSVSVPQKAVVLRSAGPNLLANPSFRLHGNEWTAYHNYQPMNITFSNQNGGEAAISLNGVSNGVQELYQFVHSNRIEALEVSGIIQISGSPLPPTASVNIMMIDSANKSQAVFGVTSANGIGAFHFAVAYNPPAPLKQFVIAVVTGQATNKTTIVTIRNPKVAKLVGGAP
ncbi:MAG TPA: hypothetical protein VMW12_11635 [Candidatus Dormibacteraeota bacterium]|nr:hypothetical protein [Candidatus Dormibacteraeota bacterium]